MNLLQNIRGRINATIAAVVGAILTLICGALLAFVISPQQAIEWRRIQNLPELDAGSFASTASGEDVAITGPLDGNAELTDDGLVAYIHERWEVTPADPDDEDDEPSGMWAMVETNVPALSVQIAGGTVETLADNSASLEGSLHETLTQGTGAEVAEFENQQLPEGSERIRGFRNGDLVTVVGTKATIGGLAADRIFGGDRVQLVENIRSGARAAFLIGIGFMICSPIILVVGVLSGLFGRKQAGS